MTAPRFSEELIARLPDGMTMPPMLTEVMDWLEAQGGRLTERNGAPLAFENQSLALYPVDDWDQAGTSLAAFEYQGPFCLNGGTPPVADEDKRVFLFVRTGGDGSYAGFWLDAAGKQWIIHFGSGSGSDWWGVISDDPADLLKLIAIGYEEPAFYEFHGKTAQEAALETAGFDSLQELAHIMAEAQSAGIEDPDAFQRTKEKLAQEFAEKLQRGESIAEDLGQSRPPVALQRYLLSEFGIETPERAADILTGPPGKEDPFAQWLDATQPPPSPQDQAQLEEIAQAAAKLAAEFETDQGQSGKSLSDRLKGWFKP